MWLNNKSNVTFLRNSNTHARTHTPKPEFLRFESIRRYLPMLNNIAHNHNASILQFTNTLKTDGHPYILDWKLKITTLIGILHASQYCSAYKYQIISNLMRIVVIYHPGARWKKNSGPEMLILGRVESRHSSSGRTPTDLFERINPLDGLTVRKLTQWDCIGLASGRRPHGTLVTNRLVRTKSSPWLTARS